MSLKINLSFMTAGGRKSTISLEDPLTDLTTETVTAAMNGIVEKGMFEGPDGEPYSSPKAASIVETKESVLL